MSAVIRIRRRVNLHARPSNDNGLHLSIPMAMRVPETIGNVRVSRAELRAAMVGVFLAGVIAGGLTMYWCL